MPELSLPAPPVDVKREPTPRPLGTIEVKPEPQDDDVSESVPPSFSVVLVLYIVYFRLFSRTHIVSLMYM